MNLTPAITTTITIALKGKKYPVTVAGSGIPCLAIGIGILVQRTLSSRFKNNFKVYSAELYWDGRYELDNPQELTLETIVDDIIELGRALRLSNYVLIGHSAYGLIALECAKKYPEIIKGVIASGTPTYSNSCIAARNTIFFEKYAELERKKIDAERRTQVAQEDLTQLTTTEKFLRTYVYRDAARYWHIPDFDCTKLWEDIVIPKVFTHFFSTILPACDVIHDIERVKCPVFLAAGKSDYDCCPVELWSEIKNLPIDFMLSRFEKSGHYPHYEEQELFDLRIEEWLKSNALI